MKKQTKRRGLALSLAFSLLLSACGASGKNPIAGIKEQMGQAQASETAPEYVGTEFEKDFIRQHIDYIEKGDFSILVSDEGNTAANMAGNYEEWGLDTVHKTWETVSNVAMIVGDSKIDLTNEYEVLLGQLIQESVSSETFQNASYSGHYAAWRTLLTDMKELFGTTGKAVETIPTLGVDETEKILKQIDDLLVLLQRLEGAKKGETIRVFEKETEKLKNNINNVIGEDGQALIKTIKSEAKYGASYLGLLGDSLDDFMDQYVLIQAYLSASEEWTRGWEAIAACMEGKNDRDTQKMSEALNSLLTQFEDSSSDLSAVLIRTAGSEVEDNIIEAMHGYGLGVLGEALDKIPIMKAIRKSMKDGRYLSNSLLNVDDIAYYGQMVMGTGIAGKYAEQALEDAADRLLAEPTYENALLFDELFHIYRSIQISACDYAIQYYNAIADSSVSHTFKYTSDDEVAYTWQLQVSRLEWEGYDCHRSFYYSWLENELTAAGGLAGDQAQASETMELLELGKKEIRDMDYQIAQQPGWDARRGILSTVIRDFDGDGQEDMALLEVEPEEDILIERIQTEVPLSGPGQKLYLSLYTIENGDVSWKDTMDIYSMNNLQDLDVRIFTFDKEDPDSPGVSLFLQANYNMLPSNYGTPTYALYRYDGEQGKIREQFHLQQTTGGSMDQGDEMAVWNEETGTSDRNLIWETNDASGINNGIYSQKAANTKEAFEMALIDRGLPDPEAAADGPEMESPDELWPDYYPSWLGAEGMENVCSITGGGTSGRSDTGYEYWMDFYDSSKLRDMLQQD